MARTAEKPESDERYAEVAYHPDEGDPITTMWNGVTFRANVPVRIPLTKTVPVLEKKETMGPDGEVRSRAFEVKRSMVEMAKTNPFFSVDGVKIDRKVGTQRLPTDSDQYRGYACAWIRAANTLKQLDERWEAEEPLREKCGVESKDIGWLSPFLEARREQLKEAA